MHNSRQWLAGLGFALITPMAFSAEQVDVLVLYTPEAASTRTGQDIQARIASYIEYSNQAYRNSQVNIQLRLVGAQTTSSSFSAVSGNTLGAFRADRSVNQLRQQYGADLVVLLTQAAGGLCGVGYIPGGNESTGRFYTNATAYAFSAVGVSCGYVTFPHELGHNMSLGHSHAQNEFGSVFPWGRGHGVPGSFSTVMAYPQSYSTRNHLQFFSNPAINRCNGMPCGSATNRADGADAATALNRLAPQIAGFMPSANISPPPGGGGGGEQPLCEKPALAQNNLIRSADFNDLSAWSNFFNAASLGTVTATTGCGRDNRLLVSNRRAYYAGPIQEITGGLVPGTEYRVSALMGLRGNNLRDSMRVTLELTDDAGTRFVNLQPLSVSSQELSRYDARFTVTSTGPIRRARLMVNGPAAGADFLLDEVKLTRLAASQPALPDPKVLLEEGFETNGNGWGGYLGTRVYRTRLNASEGRYALVSTNRESTSSGPAFNANGFIVAGEQYQLSLDVQLQSSRRGTDTAEVWAWYVDSRGPQWQRLARETLSTSSWNELSADFRLENQGPVSQVRLHVMGAQTDTRILLDNVKLSRY